MLIGSTYDSRNAPSIRPTAARSHFIPTGAGTTRSGPATRTGRTAAAHIVRRAAVGAPRWSPDGRWLALDSRAEGQPEIYVIAADGGTPRRMTNHPADDIYPSWSRDGPWIYFASDRSGRYEVWKIPKEGGRRSR